MARLLRPVMKIMSVMPAAAASSTAYWISGLSTTGSISLGLAFVTGRNRLPRPATGNTALVILPNAMTVPFFLVRPHQLLAEPKILHRHRGGQISFLFRPGPAVPFRP